MREAGYKAGFRDVISRGEISTKQLQHSATESFRQVCSPKRHDTLSGLAAASALEGEEVGVIAIAAQAKVRPPDSIALVCVQDELHLR